MDSVELLSDLYSELEQIEQEIRVLDQLDAGTESSFGSGPELSAFELERKDSGNGRRSHRRYPADWGIRCGAIGGDRVVLGKISDISTGGVRFTSSQTIAPGAMVELSIEWPVLLKGAFSVHLKGRGRVIRCAEHETVIKFEHDEFAVLYD
jgi:hypothetical protein